MKSWLRFTDLTMKTTAEFIQAFRATPSNETLGQIIFDLYMDAGKIVEDKGFTEEKQIASVMMDQHQKWLAFVKATGDQFSKSAFLRFVVSQDPQYKAYFPGLDRKKKRAHH
jgi:hypothetical protein